MVHLNRGNTIQAINRMRRGELNVDSRLSHRYNPRVSIDKLIDGSNYMLILTAQGYLTQLSQNERQNIREEAIKRIMSDNKQSIIQRNGLNSSYTLEEISNSIPNYDNLIQFYDLQVVIDRNNLQQDNDNQFQFNFQ